MINQRKIRTELKYLLDEQNILTRAASSLAFSDWDVDLLIDHIINSHHQYAKKSAVVIHDLAQKVANIHNKKHPELTKLSTTLFLFFHDLLNHMKKEEQVHFPNIKQSIKPKSYPEKGTHTTFGVVKESAILMQKTNQTLCKYLNLFHELTNDYRLPEDACGSYKYLFEKLKEFEDDLLLHVHMENNILFPKALIEEKKLKENEFVYLNSKNNGYAKKTNQAE